MSGEIRMRYACCSMSVWCVWCVWLYHAHRHVHFFPSCVASFHILSLFALFRPVLSDCSPFTSHNHSLSHHHTQISCARCHQVADIALKHNVIQKIQCQKCHLELAARLRRYVVGLCVCSRHCVLLQLLLVHFPFRMALPLLLVASVPSHTSHLGCSISCVYSVLFFGNALDCRI